MHTDGKHCAASLCSVPAGDPDVRWFRAFPLSERMEILCNFTDLALELNPDLAGKKDAQPTKGGVRILFLPISSMSHDTVMYQDEI